MRWLIAVCIAILVTQQCVAPPVQNKESEDKKESSEDESDGKLVEYHRYLNEVAEVLEGDPEFVAKLKKLSDEDLTNAVIAPELDFVNHSVRTRLDEIKRVELERLRQLANKKFEVENGIDTEHLKIPGHIDHTNPHTFEVADLKLLILKATSDLEKEDRKRREKFKEYEIAKRYEQGELKKTMDEEHQKKFEEELRKNEQKHKDHKPLHHPGSKQQLQEVWEEQDHMDTNNFDPRAFFFIHDLDGNRFWDQVEVKALFLKELDKMYNEGAPEDDLRERAEELERMREHVFNEADVDKDGLISLKEFLDQTKRPEFNVDDGWKTVDESVIYTEDEYKAFLQKRHEEMQKSLNQGAHYGNGYDPQQIHGQVPPQQQIHGQMPPPQQIHGQAPHQQQYQGQLPPQQQYQAQLPPQQQFHGQVPPQQQFHGQPPQQQFQGQLPPQNIPQPQYQGQQQIPQYQAAHPAQGQPPPQHQQQGQLPQQQQQYAQVPVQQQHVQQGQGLLQQQNIQQAHVPVQPAAAIQQNVPSQTNAQGQAPAQQPNAPALNNQAQHQAGLNQVPALQQPAGNSAQASVPNVVSV